MRKASTRLPEQGTQTPSPAPDLIPAKTKNQPRTHIAIGTADGGTSPTSIPRSALAAWPNIEADELLRGASNWGTCRKTTTLAKIEHHQFS
jgi:hypothetical protein